MKPGIITVFLAVILMLAIGCRKKTTETGSDCLSSMDFTKITFTDEVGMTLFQDTTDWKNDASWCDIEYALFNTNNLDLEGSDTSGLFTTLFPNPLRDVGIIVLIRKKTCPTQYVIVNRSFQILDTFSIPNLAGTELKELHFSDTLKYKHGQYYRIYYAAHSANQLFFYKGHGDFKID
jgi:hypothetical protein